MSDNRRITPLRSADAKPLDHEFLREFCANWYAAWNAQDSERVIGMCIDDIEWLDPTMSRPEFGPVVIERAMDMLARACRGARPRLRPGSRRPP